MSKQSARHIVMVAGKRDGARMRQNTNAIVYNKMTAAELAETYNVFKNHSDPLGWLEENRARARAVEEQLHPVKDVAYGDEPLQKLDIYTTKSVQSAPVLIDIHGGGWIQGSKNSSAIRARPLIEQNIVVAAIDYGLAPNYTMDQIIDHVRQAIVWIYRNIAQHGGNPHQLYLYGNSAGAHLVAAAMMPGWHEEYRVPEQIVRGAVAVSGLFDLEGHVYADNPSKEALNMTVEDAKRASPLLHLPTRKSRVIVAYGEQELREFIEQSKRYAAALQSVGCDVSLVEVSEANHFTIINELANVEGELFKATMNLIERS